MNDSITYCGFVAIVGRPNVGKSSLLNTILKQKVSIISFRPQTTRQQILGIKTEHNKQVVYVDTPGIQMDPKKALNRQMNKAARQSLIDVNAVIFVVEALKWTNEDEKVFQLLQNVTCPIIIAINKIDLVPEKEKLLAFIQGLVEKLPNAHIIPLSVKKQIQIEKIEQLVTDFLPESVFYFPKDQTVNHGERFHIAEIIREKIMLLLEKELPYSTCVEMLSLEQKEHLTHIESLIWVEREGQKRIIIGENGSMLREIGSRARLELERFFDKKVCLKLWVKVKDGWSDDVRALQSLGISEC